MIKTGASMTKMKIIGNKIHKQGTGPHIEFEKKACEFMNKLSIVNPFVIPGKGTSKGTVTNYKNASTLAKIISKLDDKTFYDVLWQIKWCLYIFDIVGFQHNDLHLGNILIEKKTLEGCFVDIKGNTFYKKFSHRVWIYDFDRAIKVGRPKLKKPFSEPIKHHRINNNYGWAHQTSQFKKGMNAYKVFSNIKLANRRKIPGQSFLNTIKGSNKMSQKILYNYHLLNRPLNNNYTRVLLDLGPTTKCKKVKMYDSRRLLYDF